MYRTLGIVVMAVAVLTAAAGVFGAVLGPQLVAAEGEAAVEQLDLIEAGLVATNAAVEVAGESADEIGSALDGVATTVLITGGALEATSELLDGVATLIGEDLPGTVESFRTAMPGLIATAATVDATLRAIDFLTADDYDPAVPLDEAIASLDESIAGLPDDLREQAVLLRQANGTLVGVAQRMDSTASDVVALRASLNRVERVMDQHAATTAAALEELDDVRASLASDFELARLLTIVLGVAIAASQVGSFVFGWLLFDGAIGQRPSRKEETEQPQADPD